MYSNFTIGPNLLLSLDYPTQFLPNVICAKINS